MDETRPALPKRVLIMVLLAVSIQIPPIFELLVKQNMYSHSSVATRWLVVDLVVFVAIIVWATHLFYKYRRWTPRPQGVGSRLGWLIGGYLVMIAGEDVLAILNQAIYHQSQTTNNQTIANLMGSSSLMMMLVAGSGILLSPVAEELIFRGVLMNLFFKDDAVWPPILLSGVVFTLEHASTTPVSYLIYFFMGAVFAFVYRKTSHLSNVIALHMLNNIVAMAVLLNAR